MTLINLLPERRIQASRRRTRTRAWLVLGAVYGVGLVGAWSLSAARGVDAAPVAEALAGVQVKLDLCEKQQKSLDNELRSAKARESTLAFVSAHPDWSSLLELLARERGKEVALERVTVSRGAARATAGGEPVRATASVLISGLASSQRVASDYITRLEGLKLFDTVVLTETRARAAGDSASIVSFTVSCTLSEGGRP